MDQDVQKYLQSCINTDTMDSLCASINKIGPYISDFSISNPITTARLAYYTSTNARRDSYHKFNIPKKSGGNRTITAPDGE